MCIHKKPECAFRVFRKIDEKCDILLIGEKRSKRIGVEPRETRAARVARGNPRPE
jgi:hypothetical protein